MLKRRSVLAATAGWTFAPGGAWAGSPNGPVKIVVPLSRVAPPTRRAANAEKMTPCRAAGDRQNRGGGNTIIGMELVAKSKPDGQTLLLGTRHCDQRRLGLRALRAAKRLPADLDAG